MYVPGIVVFPKLQNDAFVRKHYIPEGGQNSNFEVVHLGPPSFFYKSLMEKGNKNENTKKSKFRNCRPFFIKSAFYP